MTAQKPNLNEHNMLIKTKQFPARHWTPVTAAKTIRIHYHTFMDSGTMVDLA